MKDDSRVAVVTGGDRGIGRAIAIALGRVGINVAVNYRKNEKAALQTVKEIELFGTKAISIAADVTNDEDITNSVQETLSVFGKIDIFVSNAGVASRGNSVVDSDLGEARRLFDIHALGAMRFIKAVVPLMRQLIRGDVVVISSHATRIYRPLGGTYTMAKAALEAMALTLAREERENNIRVNVIAPGITDTDMGRRMVKARFGGEIREGVGKKMPFGRVAHPEEIAEMVRYLVSPEGSYITGQVIYINGGSW